MSTPGTGIANLSDWGCPTSGRCSASTRLYHGDVSAVVFDVPSGFVRDWLAFHDRRAARQQLLWRASVIGLGLVAASGVVLGALK